MLSGPGSTHSARGEGWGLCTALPTSSAPMWIQVERRCFSITCDRMLLSRARVSGMWGLKLLGKRSTSRRCWYFSCLRMNCREEPSGGCPGGTPVIWDGEQDWEPLTSTWPKVCTRGTTSSLCCSASCWIRSMSSSLGGQGQAQRGMPGQSVGHFPLLPLLWHPAHMAPVAPHMCALLRGTNIDLSGQEAALPSSTAWHSDRGYHGHGARWVTPSPWHTRTCRGCRHHSQLSPA